MNKKYIKAQMWGGLIGMFLALMLPEFAVKFYRILKKAYLDTIEALKHSIESYKTICVKAANEDED